MTGLLEIKQHLKVFYSRYDIYLIPAMKFLLAFFAFLFINGQIGFMERAASPAVTLLLALLCSFLPVNMIAVFGGILVCAENSDHIHREEGAEKRKQQRHLRSRKLLHKTDLLVNQQECRKGKCKFNSRNQIDIILGIKNFQALFHLK